ncbi:MAG TPA: lipid II flippase MurJ, partial [Acidimicrobiales bacterium]
MDHANGEVDQGSGVNLARDSFAAARWTLVSRVTGFARVASIAAVLGPTYFGNMFQSANVLPNITFELFAGSLLTSILVPSLVQSIDTGNSRATTRVASGFLGVVMLVLLAVAVVGAAASTLLVRLLAIGVDDPVTSAASVRSGTLLIALVMPQVVFYGVAGTCVAVQNAHGSFAFPAAAPALENLGVVATMVMFALFNGTGLAMEEVTNEHTVFLGIGATGSVALHAAAQWLGARRVGVTLMPRAGWFDDEVRHAIRASRSAMAYACCNAARLVSILAAAGSVPGGVVAFQMGMNFYHLPTALTSKPVASALVPRVARYEHTDPSLARDEYVRGRNLATFLIVPAVVAYLMLAGPLARAVSFGEMASDHGVELVTVALATLAVAMLGDGVLVVATQASYARRRGGLALSVMIVRVAVTMVGLGLSVGLFEGTTILVAMGITVSVADVVAGALLDRRLLSTWPRGGIGVRGVLARSTVAGLAMVLPAWGLTRTLYVWLGESRGAALATLAAGAVLCSIAYFDVHRALGSAEWRGALDAFRRPKPPQHVPAAASAPRTGAPFQPGGATALPRRRRGPLIILGAVASVVLALAVGPAMSIAPPMFVLAPIVAIALFGAIVARPVLGAYIWIGTTPLIVGIDRGDLIPLLRPNEAVLLLVVGAVATRGALNALRRRSIVGRLNRLDATIIALALLSSVIPLLWLAARGHVITLDDLLYALTFTKYLALYAVVRVSVRTPAQVRTCLWLSLGAACVVAIVAILQALQLFGVPRLLEAHYAPFDEQRRLYNMRGSSTIASAIGAADVMTFNLAIALAWMFKQRTHHVILLGVAALLCFGTLAAGQFSGALALVLGVVATGAITGRLGKTYLGSLPTLGAAALALRPVIQRRLGGFDSAHGIPPSWVARLENLRTFFWPELFRDFNFLLG